MAIKRPSQTYHKPAASTVESQTHGGPAQNPPKQNRTVVSQSSPVQHRNERSQLHLTQKMSKATHLSQVRLCETSGARSLLIPTPSPGSCLRCWDVLHDHSNPPYTELQIRNCHNLLFFCFFFFPPPVRSTCVLGCCAAPFWSFFSGVLFWCVCVCMSSLLLVSSLSMSGACTNNKSPQL